MLILLLLAIGFVIGFIVCKKITMNSQGEMKFCKICPYVTEHEKLNENIIEKESNIND